MTKPILRRGQAVLQRLITLLEGGGQDIPKRVRDAAAQQVRWLAPALGIDTPTPEFDFVPINRVEYWGWRVEAVSPDAGSTVCLGADRRSPEVADFWAALDLLRSADGHVATGERCGPRRASELHGFADLEGHVRGTLSTFGIRMTGVQQERQRQAFRDQLAAAGETGPVLRVIADGFITVHATLCKAAAELDGIIRKQADQHPVARSLMANSERRKRQKEVDIRMIVGNAPYSKGQENANDDNANVSYYGLDGRIKDTFAARPKQTSVKNLYDSNIRAI